MAELRTTRFSPGMLIAERYEVVRPLGKGTIGEAFHVLDTGLEYQSLAIKVLHSHLLRDATVQARFQNEVLIARQLAHENIIRVYDFSVDNDLHYLTMEYITGCNLSEVASGFERQRMPVAEVCYILFQLTEALAYAHAKKIIHRDLKPQNILVNDEGVVKLSDFGLAKSLESSHGLTRTGEVLGSPAYLAPEQFRSVPASPAADVYALGILGFELLTGRLPFEGDSLVSLAMAHQREVFPHEVLSERGVPEWLSALLADCCEKEASARPTAKEITTQISDRIREPSDKQDVQSQELLRTVVRKRSEDSKVLTPLGRFILLTVWCAAIITTMMFCIFEPGSQKRILVYAMRLELESGFPSHYLQQAMHGRAVKRYDAEAFYAETDAEDKELMTTLLDAGFSTTWRFHDETGDTVLHRAIRNNTRSVEGVVQLSFNNAVRNADGDTPLMMAIKRRATPIAINLMTNRAALNIPNKNGEYPLLLAVSTGQTWVLRKMLESSVDTPRAMIVQLRKLGWKWGNAIDTNLLTKLLNDRSILAVVPNFQMHVRNSNGLGAVHLAVTTEQDAILALLLANGLDIEMRDFQGRTPLMYAVQSSPTEAGKAILNQLLNRGAQLAARDHQGRSALEYARASGYEFWEKQLLQEMQRRGGVNAASS